MTERTTEDALAWRRVDRLQLAMVLDVHPDTITDYTRTGLPVIEVGGAGKRSVYDLVDCMHWWRNQQGLDEKEKQQTRAFAATAALNELKHDKELGKLVPREQYAREGQAFAKGWSSMLRALPRRLRALGLITREAEEAVKALIRDLLLEISSWKTIEDVEASAAKADAEDADAA